MAVLLIDYNKNDMKKLLMALMAGFFLAACNNTSDSKTDTESIGDTVNLEQDRDRNNRNTTIYDSAGKPGGDTSSYERMPIKINDSTPR